MAKQRRREKAGKPPVISPATLIEDLEQRGMLERTLVVVMSEFGRTPNINRNYGRDHWGRSFSIAVYRSENPS